MSLLGWILVFTAASALLGVLAAAGVLLLSDRAISRLVPRLVSFAIGTLLGAAFLALLPEALLNPLRPDPRPVTITLLMGILAFFLLEKFLVWRHCHMAGCEAHGGEIETARQTAAGSVIVVGDAIHNFVDGVLIGAAFLTDVRLGMITSLAVIAHEIPQELGDVAVMLHAGFGRARTLAFNIGASTTTVIGGVLAYYALPSVRWIVPYVLAVAAASFIYVAMADLIPGLHRRTEAWATLEQVSLISAGIAVIALVGSLLH